MAYGVSGSGTGGLYDVHNVVIDSAYSGMDFSGFDSLNITDNVLRRITYAGIEVNAQVAGRGPVVIERDSIACVSGVAYYGVYAQSVGLYARHNFITGCGSYAVYGGALRSGALLAGNTLRSNYHGVGLAGDTSLVVLDSNAITQSGHSAVYMSGNRLLARRNNIRNNAAFGIYAWSGAGVVHHADSNAFQGNATAAISTSALDSVSAAGNWWGVDGAAPGSPGTDVVTGRVDATNPLASQPPVPPPAPPFGRTRLTAQATAPVTPPANPPAVHPVSNLRVPVMRVPSDPTRRARAAERHARLERQLAERAQRRSEREARNRQPSQ
jgi:hypothetical protein